MNKFKGFGPVYVINLERRPDRKLYIEEHFNSYGITDFKFFNGYDGSHLDGKYALSGASIGNTMSHLLLLKHWLSSDNSDFAIICEDDISLDNSKHWDWDWEDFLKKLTFKFDVIHLSTCSFSFAMPEDLAIEKRSKKDTGLLTSCYMVSRRGARQILEKNTDAAGDIDFDFNDVRNTPDHDVLYKNVEDYYIFPLFTQSTEFGSEADSTGEFDRFHRMNYDHTRWLWKYNLKSIQDIPIVDKT